MGLRCQALQASLLRRWVLLQYFSLLIQTTRCGLKFLYGKSFQLWSEAVRKEGDSILSLHELCQSLCVSGLFLRWIWLVSVNCHWYLFHCLTGKKSLYNVSIWSGVCPPAVALWTSEGLGNKKLPEFIPGPTVCPAFGEMSRSLLMLRPLLNMSTTWAAENIDGMVENVDSTSLERCFFSNSNQ